MKSAIPLNMRCSSTGFRMKRRPAVLDNNHELLSNVMDEGGEIVLLICDLFHFMKWFSSFFLFISVYPSAPYERKIMSMELMLIMSDVWSIIPTSGNMHVSTPDFIIYPYNEGITMPSSILLAECCSRRG